MSDLQERVRLQVSPFSFGAHWCTREVGLRSLRPYVLCHGEWPGFVLRPREGNKVQLVEGEKEWVELGGELDGVGLG